MGGTGADAIDTGDGRGNRFAHPRAVKHGRALAEVATTLAAVCIVGCTNPAIYRARGTVVPVRTVSKETFEVCLNNAVKAAMSTYGRAPNRGGVCKDGILVPAASPRIGDCVVLQTQGEGSTLGRAATGRARVGLPTPNPGHLGGSCFTARNDP